jgi:hypothetical protein
LVEEIYGHFQEAIEKIQGYNLVRENGRIVQRWLLYKPVSTWRFFSRERAKRQRDWVVMSSVFVVFSLFAQTNSSSGKQASN